MTTDVRPVEPIPDHYRPAMPDRGLGRRLRAIAGVVESLLDWVPEERARYTRLGAIILNTAVMAGVSLFIALHSLSSAWPLLLLGAVLWAIVILTLDSWLIASTHGVMERRRRMLLTRLLVSILMGAFIAEPLVLWFFGPAIKGEIVRMRADDAKAERSKWVKCNPSDITLKIPKGCGDYVLNVTGSPRAATEELAGEQRTRTTLKVEIGQIAAHISKMERDGRWECNGKGGDGRSGVVGQGPNCDQARKETERYRQDSGLAAKQQQLNETDSKIAAITTQLKSGQQDYEKQIKDAIDGQMRAWQSGQTDRGILDQVRALHRLGDRSFFVSFQEWLLRLLLITIDILPVLAKMLSRETAYDVLHRRQVEAGKKLHGERLDLHQKEDTSDYKVAARRVDHQRESKLEQVAEADRSARSRRQADLDQEVERLAAELRERNRFT
jgi:hypothetical protein